MRLLPCTCSSSYRNGLHCCNCNMRHCMPCLCCATLAHYITLCLRSNWSCSHSSEHVQLHDDISRVQLQWWSVLARFCPPGRNRAAEILSARAAEIPFAPSFSPMGRNCLVVHGYRIVLCFSSRWGTFFTLLYKLLAGLPGFARDSRSIIM